MFATESQPKTEDQPPTLAEIIREVTNNGQTIIDFFHDAMNGRLDGFEPCHRIAAARELAKRGDKQAITFLQSFYPKPNGPKSNGRKPSPPIGESLPNDELAEIVREVTGNGRTIIDFLVDVMQGNLGDFKPHHRIAAAKELLRRGFDSSPGHTNNEYEDHDESFDDDPSSPNYVDPNAIRRNKEDDPFDFENYDEEQYRRDGHGGRALRHIYGNWETMIVAIDAANHSRTDAGIPKRDFTPVDNPEDDPYGKGCYGYNALSFYFHDDVAIRAANEAVEEYKKRKAKHPEGESENEGPPVDRPSCCFPQPTAPASSEEDDTLPPDHWSRPYLERIRNSSTEADESSEDPDPGESEPIQSPENPDPGESEPDQTPENPDPVESEPNQFPENPDPGKSESRQFSDAKDPPKKRPVKIYLGPPDDSPRQCRDPGDFQSAIDGIWSAAPF